MALASGIMMQDVLWLLHLKRWSSSKIPKLFVVAYSYHPFFFNIRPLIRVISDFLNY